MLPTSTAKQCQCPNPGCSESFRHPRPQRLHTLFCPYSRRISLPRDFAGSSSLSHSGSSLSIDLVMPYTSLLELFGLEAPVNYREFVYETSAVRAICSFVDNALDISSKLNISALSSFLSSMKSVYNIDNTSSSKFAGDDLITELDSYLRYMYSSVGLLGNCISTPSLGAADNDALCNFKKHTIEEGNIKFDYYALDPVKVIQNQISVTRR